MLNANALSFAYANGALALDQLTLKINHGERLAVLGANGAGKSTLLMMLNGSLRPDAGVVEFESVPVGYDRAGLLRLRSHVGLVLQDPDDQLFAATVAEDVSFGPLNMGLSTALARLRVDEALHAMGIESLAERPTHMLSFGQRKRVAIAGILAMRPSVLLLDEPMAGLDPRGADDLMETLTALAKDGSAVVVATHDMDAAYGWADRIAIFSHGKIIADGPPDSVFKDALLVEKAGLRRPVIHQIVESLIASEVLPANLIAPRNGSDLARLLSQGR
jgi:cobalt/nickel transport system ATP-binding protein